MDHSCPVCDQSFADSPHWVKCQACSSRSHPDCWDRENQCLKCEGKVFVPNDPVKNGEPLPGELFYPGSRIYVERLDGFQRYHWRSPSMGTIALFISFGILAFVCLAYSIHLVLAYVTAGLFLPIWAFMTFNALMLIRNGALMTLELTPEGIGHNNNSALLIRKFDRFQLIPWETVRGLQLLEGGIVVLVAHPRFLDRDEFPPSGTSLTIDLSAEESSRLYEEIKVYGREHGGRGLE